jgi:hypothetical protein
MHGGAIRVFTQRLQCAREHQSPTVELLLRLEQSLGITSAKTYEQFAIAALDHRNSIKELVAARKQAGRSMSGYGAAGRATTLLNFCELNRDTIEYVVDESPSRIGRYIPGVQIPIVPRSHFATCPTDDCLLTAWNYQQEIIAKEQGFLSAGGAFLAPFPNVAVIRESAECRKSA